MENKSYDVEYEKWDKVTISAQFIIACCILVTEIVNNAILYATRSQGYGPDTIVQKLLRYLVLTSSINFILVLISKRIDKSFKGDETKRYLLMLSISLMCTNVSFSHYQFSITFAVFSIPIVLSILYEDTHLSRFTLILSIIGSIIGVIARATDNMYNKDVGPEAAITFTLVIAVYLFSKMIIKTLQKRRNDVEEAVIKAEKANASAEKMTLSFKMLETLASTIDAKDSYTNGHSLRVSIYSTRLAEAIGWDEEKVDMLRYEALLHDIGKIGVPDVILNKPSKLSDVEFGLIKSHTVIGSDILRNMIAVPNASEVAKHHHERYDGKGYPSGLSGEDIPINARIVCIADAYDAMSSDRIYRKALSRDVIRTELTKGRGTQFDPEMLDVFLELFNTGKLEIKADELFMSSRDMQQGNVMSDIENVLSRVTEAGEKKSALYDFDKLYTYMRNIGIRYNRTIQVLTVEVENKTDNSSFEKETEISDMLQIAIRKNIRAVDLYHRYTLSKHIIILLDAGDENTDVIIKRIKFDYDNLITTDGYELKFTLNEGMFANLENEK